MGNESDPRRQLDERMDQLLRTIDGVATGRTDVQELDQLSAEVRRLASTLALDESYETTVTATETVGSNLKRLRESARWTQQQVATAMTDIGFGWNQATVTQTEGGTRRRASFEELFGLAALFARPVAEFLIPVGHGLDLNEMLEVGGRDAAELVLGSGATPGTGGPRWRAAARVSASAAMRPAPDLQRSTIQEK